MIVGFFLAALGTAGAIGAGVVFSAGLLDIGAETGAAAAASAGLPPLATTGAEAGELVAWRTNKASSIFSKAIW